MTLNSNMPMYIQRIYLHKTISEEFYSEIKRNLLGKCLNEIDVMISITAVQAGKSIWATPFWVQTVETISCAVPIAK